MSRVPMGIAWISCLAAASAVTAIITSNIVTSNLAANLAAPSAPPLPAPQPPTAPAATPAPTPVKVVQTPAATAEAASDQPATEDPTLAAAKLAAEDSKAFVNGLSAEQQQKLAKVLMDLHLVDIRAQNKHLMRTDILLMNFARNDKRLALTTAQQQQIQTLRDAFKGRLDPAINDLFNRLEEVRAKIDEKIDQWGPDRTSEQEDEIRQLLQEQGKLMQQINQAKAPVDADYGAAVASVLTQDQKDAMDSLAASGVGAASTTGSTSRP